MSVAKRSRQFEKTSGRPKKNRSSISPSRTGFHERMIDDMTMLRSAVGEVRGHKSNTVKMYPQISVKSPPNGIFLIVSGISAEKYHRVHIYTG